MAQGSELKARDSGLMAKRKIDANGPGPRDGGRAQILLLGHEP